MSTSSTSGLVAPPMPDESVLLLIDHQPLPYLHSHDATTVSGATRELAEAAREHGVPTVLTTVLEEYNGRLLQPLQDLFPDRRPIQRQHISPWEDHRTTDAVAATGRTKLVIAGLHTEASVTMAALPAAAAGLDVYVVTDACGGVMAETHELAVRRMAQAGVTPVTWSTLGPRWRGTGTWETTASAPDRTAEWSGDGTLAAFSWARRLLSVPAAGA
ncbi:isochorismatase family protein [Streptomyces sp. NPDC093591]|uniref:isochorismatase family protein n=1 Tax=Streptomyces sp. NPDC093591 TaxID=3366044 RepID=UPI00382CF5D3